jgi:hypothetical protein
MHHAAPLPHAVWPMPLCCLETPAASARDCQCSSEVAALTRVPLRVSTRVSIMQARAPVLRLHMLCHTTAVGCAGCSSGHASNPFRHLLCQQPMRWHCLWRGGVSQDVATYLPTYLPRMRAAWRRRTRRRMPTARRRASHGAALRAARTCVQPWSGATVLNRTLPPYFCFSVVCRSLLLIRS